MMMTTMIQMGKEETHFFHQLLNFDDVMLVFLKSGEKIFQSYIPFKLLLPDLLIIPTLFFSLFSPSFITEWF